MSEAGRKFDGGKPRWSLMPWAELAQVVAVIEFGAAKYAPDNWRSVPDGHRRYLDAMLRHVTAYASGERDDPETGLPHLAHAVCCALFTMWHGSNPR